MCPLGYTHGAWQAAGLGCAALNLQFSLTVLYFHAVLVVWVVHISYISNFVDCVNKY